MKYNFKSFFETIYLKKKYIETLNTKMLYLTKTTKFDKKKIYYNLWGDSNDVLNINHLISFIVYIKFSPTNTLLHVTDFDGQSKFFYSAGSINFSGKRKRSRLFVFKKLYRLMVKKLTFLKNQPIALHLNNVGSLKFWILKRIQKRFFVKAVKNFYFYPYNGCRKQKIRRKKIKRKKRRSGRVV